MKAENSKPSPGTPRSIELSSLSPVILPEKDFQRNFIDTTRPVTTERLNCYDRTTLAYDVFWRADRKQIGILCPTPVNFETIITEAQFASELGNHPIAEVERGRLHCIYWLKSSQCPAQLSIQSNGFRGSVTPSPDSRDIFRKLRCLVAISRNNNLEWIQDWAEFHVKKHGAEAVLIYDNNSDKYAPEDIVKALEDVRSLEVGRVVPTPFPFGPILKVARQKERFLQASVLNLARHKYLTEAHSVLSIDIDELVVSTDGQSVFEKTRNSFLGYKAFIGSVVHAGGAAKNIRHKDHVYRRKSDWNNSHAKYCIAPDGRLKNANWGTHMITGIAPWLQKAMRSRSLTHLHLKQISTGWRYKRDIPVSGLQLDKDLQRLMKSVW